MCCYTNYKTKKKKKNNCKQIYNQPFHILTAIPCEISTKITRPKLSVRAASLLSGDITICSPTRRLSGKPNLNKQNKHKM